MAINTCVLGYGVSARIFQIPYILLTPGLRLHSILQRTGDSASHDHPTAKLHRDISTVLSDPDIHLVIVSTSNASHYPITKSLLLAGKHVVVEKPFTIIASEADDLVALAKETGRLLTVFHNRRWDADFLTLRRLLSENTFGTLVSLRSHFDRYKPDNARTPTWKAQQVPGNGVLYDLGSHLVDQSLVLFGVPDRVFASVRDERGSSADPTKGYGEEGFIDDAFDAVLYYDRRLQGASITSLCERQVRFVVRGTKAGWEKWGLDLQEDQTKEGMKVEDEEFGVEKEGEWGVITTPGKGSERVQEERGWYRGFFENLVEALEGKAEVEVKAEQAAGVVRVLECLGRSEKEGRVLDVPRGPG
ncbi:ABC transporter [Trichophaea hybrida]|nr:ABC transporter [Trichophaea hybrida]